MKDKYVERLLKRDETALAEIDKAYRRLFISVAKNVLVSPEDAEECANDTLLDIWNSIPPKQPESVLSFGAMIARRRAIDMLRSKNAEKRGGGEYPIAYEELSEVADGFSDCLEGEITEALEDFLLTQGSLDRKIFIGRYFKLSPVSEIAEKLSLSENSVNIRLTKIRKKLRVFLEKRGIFA